MNAGRVQGGNNVDGDGPRYGCRLIVHMDFKVTTATAQADGLAAVRGGHRQRRFGVAVHGSLKSVGKLNRFGLGQDDATKHRMPAKHGALMFEISRLDAEGWRDESPRISALLPLKFVPENCVERIAHALAPDRRYPLEESVRR